MECDGATYHSAATARDRDKVRESVLRQLGWELVRVWSTDWWIDRRAALQQLNTRLQVLLTKRRETETEAERQRLKREAATAQQAEPLQSSAPVLPQESSTQDQLQQLKATGDEAAAAVKPRELPAEKPTDAPGSSLLPADTSQVAAPDQFQPGVYTSTTFDPEKSLLQPDRFFEPAYSALLTELIAKVVKQESPIKDDVLVERIARAHGFLRSGNRIRERVLSLTESAHYLLQEESGATFVWSDAATAGSWNLARYPATSEDCRSIEEIALPELAAAFPRVDPGAYLAQVARNFGVKRLSAQARIRLERAQNIRHSHL